jgi:hypothetical protein
MVNYAFGVIVAVAIEIEPWLMDIAAVQVSKLWNIFADIGSLRIKLSSLFNGIEDAVIRRSIRAGSSGPLPSMSIRCDIEVNEMFFKEIGSMLPLEMEILYKEGSNNHAGAVMHPSFK